MRFRWVKFWVRSTSSAAYAPSSHRRGCSSPPAPSLAKPPRRTDSGDWPTAFSTRRWISCSPSAACCARLNPSLVIVAETEIWPNLFREVKRSGAALAIVNARISDRAYPRYQRLAWFFRAVLPAADAILAQTDEIGRRYLSLGAQPAAVRTAGNFKYDFDARPAAPESPVMALLDRLAPKHVWIAASTMPPAAGDADEDDAVIAAFQRRRRVPSRPAADLGAAQAGALRRGGRQAGARRYPVRSALAPGRLGTAQRLLPGVSAARQPSAN